MKTLFEAISERPQEAFNIISIHAPDTEFEAVSHISMDEETAYWTGILVFKDKRFSPDEVPDLPGIQLQYHTPGAANGVVAVTRAGNFHAQLVGIFKSLMRSTGDEDIPLSDPATYIKTTGVIRERIIMYEPMQFLEE